MKLLETLAVSIVLLGAAAAHADDVYLANGKVYEGVVTESRNGKVRIQLAFGTLTLPASQIDRIVAGDSPVQELNRRERILEGAAGTSAEDWLALAEWARRHDFDSTARKAALEAAAIDPHLEGLSAFLVPAGYRFDEEIRRWIPVEEYMTRRGLVRYDGEWIPRTERDQRAARAEAELRAREEREATRQLRIATENLARAALIKAAVEPAREVVVIPTYGWSFPVLVHPPRRHDPDRDPPSAGPSPDPPRVVPPRINRGTYQDLIRRQPGSFIPLGQDGASRAARSSDGAKSSGG